jgi:hypothetical protein
MTTNPPPEPPEFNLDDYAREKLGGEPRLRSVGPNDEPPASNTPKTVIVNNRHLDELAGEIVDQIDKRNDPATMFVRTGRPTRIRADETGSPIIEGCDVEHMRVAAMEVCHFFRTKEDRITPATVPLDVMKTILAGRSWPFPSLLGITEAPILKADGHFVTTPGYEPTTKLYLWTTDEYPPIPILPTPGDLAAAVKVIDDILADFPFDTPADRANAWGLILTPLVRPIIEGQVPMALLDAPEPGTGKGLLAHIYTTIATGRSASMLPMPKEADELEKKITALLMAGASNVAFDNVDGTISSHVLAVALTTDLWQGRPLGTSTIVDVPNRATWLATGNNIDVGGDLARRCYRIRLDARQARPWARDGFRHPDLLGHVKRNRTDVLVALCTIIRSWWTAGQPPGDNLPAMGSYTTWVKLVGGILAHAGVPEFLGNLNAFHDSADHEANAWEAFLNAWFEHYTTGTFVTAADLTRSMDASDSTLRETLPDDLAGHLGTASFVKRLGQQLRKRAGRHYGASGLHISLGPKNRAKTATFCVIQARVLNDDAAGDIAPDQDF